MRINKNCLRGLKVAERKLKAVYARNRLFENVYAEVYGKRRLHEKKAEKRLAVSEDDITDIFSTIPKEAFEYLNSKHKNGIFDTKGDSISIVTYRDLLESVRFLIDIIEYDMVGALADKVYRNADLSEFDADGGD